MTHSARILADSISNKGHRLTTFEVTFPRIILAEVNTHTILSRNSASSRAIPVQKMLERAKNHPYIPLTWGKNQKGMSADADLDEHEANKSEYQWLKDRDHAIECVEKLLEIGVHKQLTNRLLEPFLWHTAIITATEYSNFFNLRNNPKAHPDIQLMAQLMQERYNASDPNNLRYDEWHLPLVAQEDWRDVEAYGITGRACEDAMVKISSARCARISYLTHDGKRDVMEDLKLYGRLLEPGHMSPFQHPARPMDEDEYESYRAWECITSCGRVLRFTNESLAKVGTVIPTVTASGLGEHIVHVREGAFCGNYNGWVQHRKLIPGEFDILAHKQRN